MTLSLHFYIIHTLFLQLKNAAEKSEKRCEEKKRENVGYDAFALCVENPETVDWSQYWNPLIYVDNTVGDPKETINRSVLYDIDMWHAYLVERRRVKGTFLENLELFHFPFDTQVLSYNEYFSSSFRLLLSYFLRLCFRTHLVRVRLLRMFSYLMLHCFFVAIFFTAVIFSDTIYCHD